MSILDLKDGLPDAATCFSCPRVRLLPESIKEAEPTLDDHAAIRIIALCRKTRSTTIMLMAPTLHLRTEASIPEPW